MEAFDHDDGSQSDATAVPESTTVSPDESIISTAFVEATGLTNLQTSEDLPFQSQAISSCQPTWMRDSYNQDFTVTGNVLNCEQNGMWLPDSATGNFVRNLEESAICSSFDISSKAQDTFQTNGSILTDLNNFRPYPSAQPVDDTNHSLEDELSQAFSFNNPCSSAPKVSDETVSSNTPKEEVEYHTRSGVTRPYSKRRSSVTKRNRINKRERERMHKLCEAFERLREILPSRKTLNGTEENNGKMSKICTLMMAQRYIQALQDMLDSTADENTYTNANMYVMQQQQQYAPIEYGYHS